MELESIDWRRCFLLEEACSISADNYLKNPLDANNLTIWGRALLQLSQYKNGQESKKMIEDAISKLEDALVINPLKHDALWHLGNGFTNLALMISDSNEIKGYMDKASECYQKALHVDPGNKSYIRSLERRNKSSKNQSSDLDKYALFGLIVLAVGIVTWVGLTKSW